MAQTKFMDEDNTSALVDLAEAKSQMEGQIEQDRKDQAGEDLEAAKQESSSSGMASAFIVEGMTAVVAPSSATAAIVAGVASTLLADYLDGKSKKDKKEFKSSFFVPKQASELAAPQQKRATGISMTPPSLADRNFIAKMNGAKLDIASINIASMSVAGTSMTSPAARHATGMRIVYKKTLKTSEDPELRANLDAVTRALKGDTLSINRMLDGVLKNDDKTLQAVKNKGLQSKVMRILQSA